MVGTISYGERARLGLALQGELVIDAHTHLGLGEHYAIPGPEAENLVATQDRYGIACACTFAFAGVSADYRYGNDLVAEAVARFPTRFIGYTTLNANYPEDLIPEMERCTARGLRGVKLITAYQGHPEETPRFIPVYEWCQERRKIILSHQWGAPTFLGETARRYPDICFVIGHLNLAYAEVVRGQDNVYTTTTFVPWPGAIAQAVEVFGAEKILFGSDVPDLDPSLNLGPLLTARIDDEDRRAILGRNMARILQEYG
jgi:predicted TIM-barrel fold metal-dependent hydrolase